MKKKFKYLFLTMFMGFVSLYIVAGCCGYKTAVVLSGSMSGTYEVDDLLIVKGQEKYEVNDVIMFKQGKLPTTHRIVGEQDGGFVTKGDANNTIDRYLVEPNQVIGSVVHCFPKAGRIVEFLKSPVTVSAFFIMAIFLTSYQDKVVNKDEKQS